MNIPVERLTEAVARAREIEAANEALEIIISITEQGFRVRARFVATAVIYFHHVTFGAVAEADFNLLAEAVDHSASVLRLKIPVAA